MLFFHFVQQQICNVPVLRDFVDVVSVMTIGERALVLKLVQFGRPLYTGNIRLKGFQELLNTPRWHVENPSHPAKLVRYFDVMQDHYSLRSLAWSIVLMLETTAEEGHEVIQKGLYKELQASQDLRSIESSFDYSWLHSYKIEPPLSPSFRQSAIAFKQGLLSIYKKWRVIRFPQYQRRKNTSQQTGLLYTQSCDDVSAISEVTTLHLEKLNFARGVKISGSSEMRSVWRYNELKPRLYYCAGGDQYWTSRYAKSIAVDFMDANVVTQMSSRRDPDLHLMGRNDRTELDHVAFWDYSSFTTRFSELRHFLFYVAQALREDPVDAQYPLQFFDPWDGIQHIRLSDYLFEYNEVVNIHAGFSLHRLIKFLPEECPLDKVQQNSGMLGVHGNIGFSTTLHGILVSSQLADPGDACCVGDDAVAVARDVPRLLRFMSNFGELVVDKCDVLEYSAEEPQYARFMKRCFRWLDQDFAMDKILKLPSALLACTDSRPGRVSLFSDADDAIHKIASQVATLLWSLKRTFFDASDDDQQIFIDWCLTMYRAKGLPFAGALPGSFIRFQDQVIEMRLCLPMLSHAVDYRVVDWTEVLYREHVLSPIKIPLMTSAKSTPAIQVGTFVATSSRALQFLCDLGKGHQESNP